MMAMDLQKAARVAGVVAVLLLPVAARASGSWAVPRFTPTWAELERDLKLLGMKAPPKLAKRAPAKKPPVVVAQKQPPPTGTGPVEEATGPAEGTGKPNDRATVAGTLSGGVCQCPEPGPVPVQVRCPVTELAEPATAQPADKGKKPSGKEAAPKKIQRKKYWWQDE